MPDLVLNSLEIQNFRGLKELQIERLGRVNLIVGKNNVGKTTILEALRLYAFPGDFLTLLDLLESRDQFDPNPSRQKVRGRGFRLSFEGLFYGEVEQIQNPQNKIRIGPKGLPGGSLSIQAQYASDVEDPQGIHRSYLLFTTGVLNNRVSMSGPDNNDLLAVINQTGFFETTSANASIPSAYVGPGGLKGSQMESRWDAIALTSSEDEVLEAMRLIVSKVERLVLKPVNPGSDTRVPFVKLEDRKYPVALRSLGDGMIRIFGIALSLVNAKHGLLLVDEIENGLHYSVQPDVWRFIFRSAAELNVQVFATTHSYDCIKAFEEAAREHEEEGVLIRLAQKAGRTLVGEFDERELGIAVDGQIEVR